MSETLEPVRLYGKPESSEVEEVTEGLGEMTITPEANPFEFHKAEGNTLVKREKYSEALAKYEEAWGHCKTDDDRAMLLNNRGVVYEKMGESGKALEIFGDALALKPEYIKVLVRRAIVNKKMNNLDEALNDISEAHVLALKNEQMVTGVQETYEGILMEIGEQEFLKLTEGREFPPPRPYCIRTFLRSFYSDPISRIWKGLDPVPLADQESDGQGDGKKRGFLAALDSLIVENWRDIVEHCSAEIDNPESDKKYRLEALLLRGSMQFLAGKKDEALADYLAITSDETASNELKSAAFVKLALCTNQWGTTEDTAEFFSQAEMLWKGNADLYYHAAVSLVDKCEPVPALALLEKGMEICSDAKKFPLLHAMGLAIRLSYDACSGCPLAAYEKMKQLETDGVLDTPECYELLAQTVMLMETDPDKGLAAFQKALEFSGNEKLFSLKKSMAVHLVKNDCEATINALLELSEDPDVGHICLYHIGEMKTLMGDNEAAVEAFDKSIERCQSAFDIRLRIMAKLESKYNNIIVEKLKVYGVNLDNARELKDACSE